MTDKILPQEFLLLNDNPVVRTRCPAALITDLMIEQRAVNGNLSAGDGILVQCFDHNYQILLAEAEYRVVSRTANLRTHEVNDRETRQFEDIKYRVERVTDWRQFGDIEEAPAPQPFEKRERYIDGDCYREWNAVARVHEIKRRSDDSVVCAHTDKETAERIAAGELPVPEPVAA